jgi:isocitrate/isopropylmalate dehydrogenase
MHGDHLGDTGWTVAVISDGIGEEVVPDEVRVLEKVPSHHGFTLQQGWFDFVSCD